MVSLDPELSKLFILLMSTSATFGSQNGPTRANFLKRKLETSFLQHESKIEDSLRFFPDNGNNENNNRNKNKHNNNNSNDKNNDNISKLSANVAILS